MEGFGRYLQKAREKKGLSLEKVASQTRIQQKYLEALESEDFVSLPGKVFAKGFVRSYAKTLGLNDEDALQRFLDTSRSFYEQTHLEQQHHQTTVQAEHRGKFNRNLILGLFVILGVGLFYFLPSQQQSPDIEEKQELPSSHDQLEVPPSPVIDSRTPDSIPPNVDTALPSPETNPSPATNQEASLDPTANPAPREVSDQPQTTPPAVTTPEPQPVEPDAQSPQAGGYLLEIEATQLTWVVVRSDDQPPNEALLQPGQRITWKASKQFLLTLGNAAGVAVRLNGEAQGPFGKPGQVVRDILIKP